MIEQKDLEAIRDKNITIKEVAEKNNVHRTTVSRHYRKFTNKKTWNKHQGKVCRYDAKKAERSYYLRLSGKTWPEIAKVIYKDKSRAEHAYRLAEYYKRDFCG